MADRVVVLTTRGDAETSASALYIHDHGAEILHLIRAAEQRRLVSSSVAATLARLTGLAHEAHPTTAQGVLLLRADPEVGNNYRGDNGLVLYDVDARTVTCIRGRLAKTHGSEPRPITDDMLAAQEAAHELRIKRLTNVLASMRTRGIVVDMALRPMPLRQGPRRADDVAGAAAPVSDHERPGASLQ